MTQKWLAQLCLWLYGWLVSQDGVLHWNIILVIRTRVHFECQINSGISCFFFVRSGYKLDDFVDIVLILNTGLHRKQSDSVKHVRNKYSHKLFHEVATVPLQSNDELLEGTELHKRETVINFGQAL